MNVGSVKETDRRSFDLITPYRVFRFVNAVLYKSLLFTQKMPKTYFYWMGFYNLPASNITVASINSLVHIFTKVWQCFHVFGAVILGDALTHLVDNSPSSAQKVKQTKVCHFVWEDGGACKCAQACWSCGWRMQCRGSAWQDGELWRGLSVFSDAVFWLCETMFSFCLILNIWLSFADVSTFLMLTFTVKKIFYVGYIFKEPLQ